MKLIYFHANKEKRAAEVEIRQLVPPEHIAGSVGSWTQFKLGVLAWRWFPFLLTPPLTCPSVARRLERPIPGGASTHHPQRSLCCRDALGAYQWAVQSPGIQGRLNKQHSTRAIAWVNVLPEAAPVCQKRVVKELWSFPQSFKQNKNVVKIVSLKTPLCPKVSITACFAHTEYKILTNDF